MPPLLSQHAFCLSTPFVYVYIYYCLPKRYIFILFSVVSFCFVCFCFCFCFLFSLLSFCFLVLFFFFNREWGVRGQLPSNYVGDDGILNYRSCFLFFLFFCFVQSDDVEMDDGILNLIIIILCSIRTLNCFPCFVSIRRAVFVSDWSFFSLWTITGDHS